jgi:glycosyltransferase involved in cell wall biosynthesis
VPFRWPIQKVIFMEISKFPLVSIICTAFNHEGYIEKALDSGLAQSYPNLELIIIDNASEDGTKKIIETWVLENKNKIPIQKIFRVYPMPYCASFNEAFLMSKGKYFIDLSGDDILQPDHIRFSVEKLESNPDAVICFSDAYLNNEDDHLKTFYQRNKEGHLQQPVIQGDIFEKLVSRHIILSVTMVVRSESFKSIGMYDESLSYEDFDIMVRMARSHPFVFSDHIGVVKNIHRGSLSSGQYRARNSVMLPSTLKVCFKIKAMNRTVGEDNALKERVKFELKHALLSANFEVAKGFLELGKSLGASGLEFWFFTMWAKNQWDISDFYSKFKKS